MVDDLKPILFDENSIIFTTNGIGRLDCISCKVTEERNGMYELEAVVPESAKHFSDLAMSRIIVAKPSDGGSLQPFRIYKITKPINGKSTVYAQHLSYQLSYIPTMPFSVDASSTACATVLSRLKSNAVQPCPFSFWTDVTTVASYKQDVPSSIRQRLGGIEGSVLDQFGGEFEWTNWLVKLHKFRGVQNPTVTLRYGKNITDIEQEEYISNTITGVCPFWRASDGSKVVTLTEKVVESQYASQYPFKRTVPLDLSTSFEEEPTQAQLRASAQAAVNEEGVGIPTVSIKVSFVALWQTEEYKDIAPLQRVNLCDKVNVQFEKLGINTTAKVVKTVYDVLAERYESIEIGSLKTSLAQAISDTNSAITTALETASFEVRNATAWLTGSNGYVVANRNTDGSWKELLFMDTPDVETAVRVLRINENGLGFSSHGVDGPYEQAWTLDGKIVIGSSEAPSLTVQDAQGNVLFKVSRDGTVWNSPKSRMTAEGVLTADGATLNSAKVYGLIEAANSSGNRKVVVSSGTIDFHVGSNNVAQMYVPTNSSESHNLHIYSESGYNIYIDAGNYARIGSVGGASATFKPSGNMELNGAGELNIVVDRTHIGGTSLTIGADTIYLNPGDIVVHGDYGYSGTISIGDSTLEFSNGICIDAY